MSADISKKAHAARTATLVTSSLGAVIVLLNVTIVNVATPYIGKSFDADVSVLQWMLNAYTLTFASFLLPAGVLGDRYGSRRIFMIGVTLFALASLASALSPSIASLIAARTGQGLAAALILPTSLSLLSGAYFGDDAARARAVGLWSAIGGVISAAGPALGGILIANLGWPSIFAINIPLCLITYLCARARVGETSLFLARSFDVPGQLFAMLLFSIATATFIEAGRSGWGSTQVALGGAASAGFLLAFLFAEQRAADPVLPLQLLRLPSLSMPLLLGLITNLAFYGLIFVLSIYFQRVRGYSPSETGLAFLPFVVIMLGNIASAPLANRYGYRCPVMLGLGVTGLGYFLLSVLLSDSTPYTSILPSLILMAIGGGLTVPALTAMLLASAEQERTATLSGIFNTGRQVGAALGVAVFGTFLVPGSALSLSAGVALSFSISGQLLLVSMAIALWVLPARQIGISANGLESR